MVHHCTWFEVVKGAAVRLLAGEGSLWGALVQLRYRARRGSCAAAAAKQRQSSGSGSGSSTGTPQQCESVQQAWG
jgi:hypothetical protein